MAMARKAAMTAVTVWMVAAICALCAGRADADVIYLKNGNVIRGTVVEQNESTVKVKFGSIGDMTLTRDEIHSIQTNELEYKPLGTATPVESIDPETTEPGEMPAETVAEPLTEAEQTALDESLAKLKSDDQNMWREAEDELAEMGPKIFGRLEQALATAERPTETAFLMSSMSRIDATRAVGPIAAKAGDTSEMTRQAAVVMLGEIGDRRGTDTLVTCLEDTKYFVRRDAASALGRIGDQKALPALVRATRDNDPEVRQAAMASLKNITKMEYSSGEQWQQWWQKQSATPVQ